MPQETLDCLLKLSLPVRFIQGNADREVLEQLTDGDAQELPEEIQEVTRWVASQLAPKHAQLIASWPTTLRLEIDGIGEVLFCHATPRSDTELFTRLTPEECLLPIFAELDVPLVVCGHTHMQFERRIGPVRVVNAGSVGMPYGAAGAYWLLLGPDIQFRRSDYDRGQAAARILATSYPQAHEFAANNVLQPPSEAEALAVFTQMEQGPQETV